MPALERRISLRGPRFWTEGDVLMFCNQIDGSTRDGPRTATPEDVQAHPEAFEASAEPGSEAPGAPMIGTREAGRPSPAPKPHADRRNRTLEQA